MLEMWIKFAHGEAPWESFGEKQRWMVFKESGAKLMTKEEDVGRGYEQWDALHKHGLVAEVSDLSDELCIRRTDLLTKGARGSAGIAVEGAAGDAGNNVM